MCDRLASKFEGSIPRLCVSVERYVVILLLLQTTRLPSDPEATRREKSPEDLRVEI